jgi:hypothetical protein
MLDRLSRGMHDEVLRLPTPGFPPTRPSHRLWKRSWALRTLARVAREDSARLCAEAEDLVARLRRSRMRVG